MTREIQILLPAVWQSKASTKGRPLRVCQRLCCPSTGEMHLKWRRCIRWVWVGWPTMTNRWTQRRRWTNWTTRRRFALNFDWNCCNRRTSVGIACDGCLAGATHGFKILFTSRLPVPFRCWPYIYQCGILYRNPSVYWESGWKVGGKRKPTILLSNACSYEPPEEVTMLNLKAPTKPSMLLHMTSSVWCLGRDIYEYTTSAMSCETNWESMCFGMQGPQGLLNINCMVGVVTAYTLKV